MKFKYLLLMTFLISSSHASTRKFWSRRWHQSTLAGNWLYIDGGDIAYGDNTTVGEGRYDRENNTYGLDLSKDWTNSSIDMIQTERPSDSRALNGEALWYDSKRNIIYCFGGERSYATPALSSLGPPTDSIWGFKPNGAGSGVWAQVLGPDSTSFPSEFHRVAFGATASNGSTAYHFGGYSSWETTPALQESQGRFSSGLLRFEFDTLTITHATDDEQLYSQKAGEMIGKAMIDIPIYGENGILVILPDAAGTTNAGFDNIILYDKKSNKVYSQAATGDIPEPRRAFCAVGIKGDKPSYFEIFMHGGVINDVFGPQTQNSDQVYILSLPSFRWFRANYTAASPRAAHTCDATTSGQMIMIGGQDPTYFGHDFGTPNGSATLDPWSQGIGVFDMTALRFKDSYQAKAEAYKTPQVIQNYHSIDGHKYPSSWTSAAVKELFEGKSNTPSNATNVTTGNLTAPNATSSISTSPSGLHHGAVAGIAVGCASAFVLSAVGAILIVKHRSNRIRAIEAPNDTEPIYSTHSALGELPAEWRAYEIQSPYQDRAELPNKGRRHVMEIGTSEPTIAELSNSKQ